MSHNVNKTSERWVEKESNNKILCLFNQLDSIIIIPLSEYSIYIEVTVRLEASSSVIYDLNYGLRYYAGSCVMPPRDNPEFTELSFLPTPQAANSGYQRLLLSHGYQSPMLLRSEPIAPSDATDI